MPRKRYSTEQIVTKLRQAEVELGRGLRTPVGLEFRIRSLNRGLGHHCVAPEF